MIAPVHFWELSGDYTSVLTVVYVCRSESSDLWPITGNRDGGHTPAAERFTLRPCADGSGTLRPPPDSELREASSTHLS